VVPVPKVLLQEKSEIISTTMGFSA